MSSHGARVPCESLLDNKRLNLIPIGRQLQRTPPTKISNTQTTCPSEEPAIMEEEDSQMVPEDGADGGKDDAMCPFVNGERKSYRRSSVTSASAKMWNADPEAFIQGMQGYQWTDADLEFVYHAKQQKRAQRLQQELSEVEKTLQVETQRLELAVASRDQLRFKLSKTLSCDVLLQLCKSVLSCSRTSDQLDGLGDKALLSLLDLQDVQRAVCEENTKISHLVRDAAKAQELRDVEEKAMRDMDICQKKISTLQANIDALKVELAGLKTRLLEKEASVVSQVPEKGRTLSRRAKPSTKAPKEKVLKETAEKEMARKEKAGKDTCEEGKMARKEKASKKTTLKKNVKKETSPEEIAPSETPSQVKTPVEMDTEKMSPKKKLKKTLKRSTENETVSMEMAEKGNIAPKIKASKKTNSKKAAETELAPDETASQVKTPEETAQEETAPEKMHPKVKYSNMAEVLEKGRKGSGTAKTPTMAPKDKGQNKTPLKRSTKNETVSMETAEKGNIAPKIKASKKTNSKKAAETKLAPDETASQVKTPEETAQEETALEKMPPKVKYSNMAEVLEKGRKGSGTAKTPTMVPKDKGQNKTPLKRSTKNETVSMETAEKGNTAPKIKAPKKTTSKTAAEKELVTDETTSQVKPEEIAQEDTAPEKMPPKVKYSNVVQALEKGRKGSRTAETSTTVRKDKALKAALTESTENKMTSMETVDKEMAENGNTAPKIKAPKKTAAKKNAKKELATHETVKTLEETAPEELPPKVKSLNVVVLKNGCKGSTTAKLSTIALKEKGLTKNALGETGEKETDQIEADDKGKSTRQVKAPKKVTSKNTAEKEMASQLKTLHENVLGELPLKVRAQKIMSPKKTDERAPEETSMEETRPKASKRKAPKKMASKKTADMEMPTELTVEGATSTKKMTSKVRGRKKMDLTKTAMQEIAEDEQNCLLQSMKNGLKGADTPKKEMAVKNKVKNETDPEETASEKMTLKEVDDKVTSMKAASNMKAPKKMPEKETILSRRASKEKEPKQKAGKNPSEDEDSLNAVQALGRARNAAKPPNSPLGSDPETLQVIIRGGKCVFLLML
ncbi:hypothetical protein AMELA_G00001450 [Ameiurus melas]|uniref:Uncharacterized protein n=1 Tax=Ameiurus melas TaxID=219545 RepID=A0A7J6BE50_AMEME|nr:hypothetical protein AMELA_G00001450 [Ameiurus melas]